MSTTATRRAYTAPPAGPVTRAGAPGAFAAAALASLLIVFLLWVHGGGVPSLRLGAASALTSMGRLSGLVAADLLLMQVLLMARVPWIERSYGQDRLARIHRLVGFTSFNLMLVHILTITIGYAGTDRSGLVAEAWNLVTTYPGMLLAALGSAALVLVAVTSVRAARARLRYESWHLLHLYAYIGVGLSLPHQLWSGADFLTSPLASVYWWTVYIVTLACVVTFRLGLPIWRSVYHDLRVDRVVSEGAGTTSVYLRGRHLDRMPVRAGQFFHWRFLGRPGWTRAHPYSLSAPPRANMLRITVKELGDGSRDLRSLRRGTRVLVEGPYGRLTGAVRTWRHLTMIACGIGITPLRALLESESYHPGDALLIYRARRPADFMFTREIDHLAQSRGVRVVYLPGARGPHGSWLPAGAGDEVAALTRFAPNVRASDVFVCGPEDWMASVVACLDRTGVAPSQVHVERFDW
jgi:predicted ferric reductase